MKTSTILFAVLLALPLAAMLVSAPSASAQTASTQATSTAPLAVGLLCPFEGGTCEATPQLPLGFTYFFRSQGNAYISRPSPIGSPIAAVRCLRLFPSVGRITVTVVAPDGRQGTASVGVCPAIRDDGGPIFPN